MAKYFVKIELYSANYQNYEVLQAGMEKRGYSRTITNDEGLNYQLPAGNFVIVNTPLSLEAAINLAMEALNSTRKKGSIIVIDWNSAKWDGLPSA